MCFIYQNDGQDVYGNHFALEVLFFNHLVTSIVPITIIMIARDKVWIMNMGIQTNCSREGRNMIIELN